MPEIVDFPLHREFTAGMLRPPSVDGDAHTPNSAKGERVMNATRCGVARRLVRGAGLALLAAGAFGGQASAEMVLVELRGIVEFNQVNAPPVGNLTAGTEVLLSLMLDSEEFTDSTTYPTRGYLISDFIADSVDFPIGVELDAPGIFGAFSHDFSVSYVGDTLGSLDLLDAVGTYGFGGLKSFNWVIDDGPFSPVGLVFDSMEISVVPAPAPLVVGGLWGVLRGGRSRRRDSAVA
jgi:hypothetical protein